MKLLFLVQKSAWFVEHGSDWYRLHDMQQVSLALSGLSLNLVDQHSLVEQPHQAGTACVSHADKKALCVVLRSIDNCVKEKIRIELDENVLIDVDWSSKPSADGWLNSEVFLKLDNVSSMYADVYLPACNDSKGKTLTITDTSTGQCVDVWIARNCKSRIPILAKGGCGKIQLKLRCEPEEMTQTSDRRQLGFIMIAQEARAA